MKKNRSLVCAFILLSLVLVGCGNSNSIDIPEGEYALTERRTDNALSCDMSKLTFGKTITINNGMINTNKDLVISVNYKIKKLTETTFLTTAPNPTGDSTVINFSYNAANSQLVFSCESENIIYQKK